MWMVMVSSARLFMGGWSVGSRTSSSSFSINERLIFFSALLSEFSRKITG